VDPRFANLDERTRDRLELGEETAAYTKESVPVLEQLARVGAVEKLTIHRNVYGLGWTDVVAWRVRR
jgi:hypothetical protein